MGAVAEESAGERGVALVIVLGLVALIGAWASTAAYEDMIALRRAENMQDAMRALQASKSGFALAVMTLRQDARDSTTDDLGETWAVETPPFPIDGGMVAGHIVDTDRYLNLNDLVDSKGQAQLPVVAMYKTLFRQLELDEGLVDALADWMDADGRPNGISGAEEATYLDKPYRIKNRPLDSWSEVQMVKGFDAEVLARLADVAVVMPVAQSGITPVNVNTASAAILKALFPQMTDADAEALIAGRPYTDVGSVITGRPWAAGANPARLSVASSAFMVRTDARFGRVILREEYVVQRQSTKMTLLSRQRLGWDQP